MSKSYLSNFVLVGGTSLSLQIGHRASIDFDFFTNTIFDADSLFEKLQQDYSVEPPQVQDKSTLIATIDGVKVDFIRFRYSFNKPILEIDGLRLVDVEDIAPMKLDAIMGRGRKKDFYDLFFLLEKFSLPQMLSFYDSMFHHETIFHVWKSLTYFQDAEKDADPFVFDKTVTWTTVKETIEEAVRQLK